MTEAAGTRKSRLQKKKDILAEIEKELREGPAEGATWTLQIALGACSACFAKTFFA